MLPFLLLLVSSSSCLRRPRQLDEDLIDKDIENEILDYDLKLNSTKVIPEDTSIHKAHGNLTKVSTNDDDYVDIVDVLNGTEAGGDIFDSVANFFGK